MPSRAPRGKPVVFRGTWYPSRTALARAIGVTRQAVHDAIRRGRLETCGDDGGRGGARAGAGAPGVICAAHGWSWPSLAAAAREMGVAYTVAWGALERGTFADLVLRRLGPKGGAA